MKNKTMFSWHNKLENVGETCRKYSIHVLAYFKGAQSFILARIQGAYNDVYMYITENSKWFDFSENLSAMTGLQREMANGFQDTR